MGIGRMFWLTCDVCNTQCDWGEWYAAVAIDRARNEGWRITGNGKRAVCLECQ